MLLRGRATVGDQRTYGSVWERQKLGVAGRGNWYHPEAPYLQYAKCKSLFLHFICLYLYVASLLSRDIMPSEDEHLVFVIHRKHTNSGTDIAVT